jgi:hypothetical protein
MLHKKWMYIYIPVNTVIIYRIIVNPDGMVPCDQ